MADYNSAAVCRRGHIATNRIEYSEAPPPKRCAECGAEVMTECPHCSYRIRGAAVGFHGADEAPPDFCDKCGGPFPWLSRQGLIYQLENMLDDEDLDPATKLEVREQLEALTSPDLDDEEQLRRWAKVKELAPTMWEKSGAQRILESVVSAAVKGTLGL